MRYSLASLCLLGTLLATAVQAQPAPPPPPPPNGADAGGGGGGPANPARLAALKQKITDAIDERIGRLEEQEECIKAAADMQAVRACRPPPPPPPQGNGAGK